MFEGSPRHNDAARLEMMRVDHARKLQYSEFFAQLQVAQDLLADTLGTCLVLVDREAKEITLPSRLPLTCNEHQDCATCHAQFIAQLDADRDDYLTRCPKGQYLLAMKTSIRTDDGSLYLLAGRTQDRSQAGQHAELLRAIYSLPFQMPNPLKKNVPAVSAQGTASGTLSNQESKVLACMVSGLTNKDIAHQLCISQSTVKAHVASIFKKLNLSNRTEASVYALKNGIKLGDEDV